MSRMITIIITTIMYGYITTIITMPTIQTACTSRLARVILAQCALEISRRSSNKAHNNSNTNGNSNNSRDNSNSSNTQ